MPTLELRDANNNTVHLAITDGDGTPGDPYVVTIGATLGDVVVENVTIAAGDNNIGNVDLASAIPAGTNNIGGTTDNGPHWTSVFGVSGAPFTSADQSASAASVTDAPTAGQKLVITDLLVSVDTAMSVSFKIETAGTTLIGPIYLPANGSAQITFRSKFKLGTADKKLQVQSSVAGNISVLAGYYSEA